MPESEESPPPVVGSSSSTSAARHSPWSPASCEGVRFVCRFSFADARGVGRSCTASQSVIPECTVEPGERPAVAFRVFLESATTGVGSRPGEDKDAPAEMAGPGTGRGKTRPFRIEPDFGQVCENGSKCPHSRFSTGVSQAPRAGFHVAIGSLTEQLLDVFDDHQRRPQFGYRAGDEMPHTAPVALPEARPAPRTRDIGAGEPGGQHVHGLNRRPVRLADVSEVGHAGEVMGEDGGLVRVVVGHPCELAAEHLMDGQVQAQVATA